MKHVFIVNPVSGKGKIAKAYISTIENYIKEHNIDAEIYITRESRDGLKHVEELAKTGEEIRFYSCGGDGTLQETANGIPVPYEIAPRRPGDLATCYADPAKSAEKLGWKAEKTLVDMCRDSWRWQSQNPMGYGE